MLYFNELTCTQDHAQLLGMGCRCQHAGLAAILAAATVKCRVWPFQEFRMAPQIIRISLPIGESDLAVLADGDSQALSCSAGCGWCTTCCNFAVVAGGQAGGVQSAVEVSAAS